MKRRLMIAAPVAAIASLVLPGMAFGAETPILDTPEASINAMWVIVAAVLVMFMQAGFLLLEVGFSRAKNAGAGVAKVLVNFSIASLCYWAVGFALAFGGLGEIAGTHGFFLDVGSSIEEAGKSIPFVETYSISPAAFMFFQFVFCAVSLAIVWGATLERIKFGAYIIYAIIFSAVLYPVLSHWIFGGGWLQVNVGMQDFAGSTVVHLIGATGAFAALLLLGPRIGKYTREGKPRAIPGHSMPLVGLGVLILWLGWFGFNPGSTLGAMGGRFAEVVVVTNLAAAAGVVAAVAVMWAKTKTIDIGMAGNGAIAGLVAITAPSGYVEYWAAPIIGAIAGVIVGIFTSPRLAEFNEVGDPGLWYSGSFHQLGAQALGVGVAFACVFVVSYAIFFVIKKTIGLRVTAEEEDAGLDISEHGMYGYPEQFIPQPEYSTGAQYSSTPASPAAPAPAVSTPMTSES
jgi:ammonium transporter, Amt family